MVVEGCHEGHQRHVLGRQPSHHVEPTPLGHLQVQQREVRPEGGDERHGLLAVGGFPDEFHVLAALQERGEEPPRRPFIVRDEDSQRLRHDACSITRS